MSVARDAHEEPVYGLGYYRISGSKEQKDSGLSIPAQESHVRPAIDRENVIFVDSDTDILTGKRADRRGYQRILATARRLQAEGKSVAIFVLGLDRFGRELEERTRAWKELRAAGIRMYSVRQGGWIKDPFIYHIDSVLAQREVDIISTRVKETNVFVLRNGFPRIGRAAWGYRHRDATPEERSAGCSHKNLEPHPVEAPLLREAFERRTAGASLHSIHRWVRSLSYDERGGRPVTYRMIYMLFRTAVYVGRLDYPKGHEHHDTPILERPRGKWEPLITDAVFARCDTQRDRARRVPPQASGLYLLSGLLRCPKCGTRMSGNLHAKPSTAANPRRYRCNREGKGAVDAPQCYYTVPASVLDDLVLNHAQWMLTPYRQPDRAARLEKMWERMRQATTGASDVPQRIAGSEARLSKWKRASGAAFAAKVSGELTQAECDEIRQQAQGEIEDAERELARLRASLQPDQRLPRLREVLAHTHGVIGLLQAGRTAQKRTVLVDYFVSIIPVRLKPGAYRVQVEYTDLGLQLLHVSQQMTGERATHGVDPFAHPKYSTPCLC